MSFAPATPVERAASSARGEAGLSTGTDDEAAVDAEDAASLEVSDSLRRVENLHATLTQLALVLGSRAALPDAAR